MAMQPMWGKGQKASKVVCPAALVESCAAPHAMQPRGAKPEKIEKCRYLTYRHCTTLPTRKSFSGLNTTQIQQPLGPDVENCS